MDDNQASKRDLDQTRDVCTSTQESPEKKLIVPQTPSILDLGVKNRIVNEFLTSPWDDYPCYPPYTAHVCCSGPATQLDWLTRLYANVEGCLPCSFCAHTLCSFGSCSSWHDSSGSGICAAGTWEFCCEVASRVVDDFPGGPFCILIGNGESGPPWPPGQRRVPWRRLWSMN